MPVSYQGLVELGQALKEIDQDLLRELRGSLQEAGDVVREDAASLLRAKYGQHAGKSAAGFRTRVRLGTSSTAVLTVEQSLRKTNRRHGKWGAIQVEDALLPARDRKEAKVADILEHGTQEILRAHGF